MKNGSSNEAQPLCAWKRARSNSQMQWRFSSSSFCHFQVLWLYFTNGSSTSLNVYAHIWRNKVQVHSYNGNICMAYVWNAQWMQFQNQIQTHTHARAQTGQAHALRKMRSMHLVYVEKDMAYAHISRCRSSTLFLKLHTHTLTCFDACLAWITLNYGR